MELFDAAAEDKGGHLKAVGDRRVLVRGDRDLLFDAVANLVDNAIKYGGDAGQVTVEVKESDGGAVISVADDGPGIPVDEGQHVFKRFYRPEQSRRTPGNGLDFVPTSNAMVVGNNHIVLAKGRDYADNSLIAGIILGSREQDVDVQVDVMPRW